MRFSTTVKVKPNGKADISMVYAINKDLDEMGDEADDTRLSEDEVAAFEAKGWSYDAYSEENFVGYKLYKKDVDINELSDAFESSEEEGPINPDQLKVQRNGLTYIIDWKMFEDVQQEQISEYKSYLSLSGGYMNFVLELPFKASSSNATRVSEDGKTLEWDLLALPEEGIHVEFSLLNIPLIIGCIAAVAFVVLVIVIVVIIVITRKKKMAYAQQPIGYSGMAPMGQGDYMNPNQMPVSPVVQPEISNVEPERAAEQVQNSSVADEILKLKNLMDSRVITAEEFEAQKKKLLGE